MDLTALLRRHPIASYFVAAYAISWGGSLLVAGPELVRGEPLPLGDVLLMLVFMLAGPALAGVLLTSVTDGRAGLRELAARIGRWRVGGTWYVVALLLPPVLILSVLLALALLVSPVYTPGFLAVGVVYGVLAGGFEEVGWMGFAYPRMQRTRDALSAALLLGLLWGLWHGVAGYLGSAERLGTYWLPNFLALWIAGMTAMRVLIAWVYVNTRSVLLCQIMHASSTGSLAVLAPTPVLAVQETLWYALYAVLLWVVVVVVARRYGTSLRGAEPLASRPG